MLLKVFSTVCYLLEVLLISEMQVYASAVSPALLDMLGDGTSTFLTPHVHVRGGPDFADFPEGRF